MSVTDLVPAIQELVALVFSHIGIDTAFYLQRVRSPAFGETHPMTPFNN